MRAIEVNDATTLVFTTVLEPVVLGLEEDEAEEEPKDRNYWERKGSKATLNLTDELHEIVRQTDPSVTLKYNKNYIGLARDGIATNYITFRPKKQHVLSEYKIPRSDELTQQLQDAGMDVLTYQVRWGRYRVRVTREDLENRGDMLRQLSSTAREHYGP
jgi:predicted transport protein